MAVEVGDGMWLIPALLHLGAVGNLATTKWGEIDHVASYALWLGIGTLLVGFSEELLTRVLAIVDDRGSMHERWVWVFSGVIFGSLHIPNSFFGQSVKDTAQEVVFAFAVGLAYYVTRRLAGTLIVTMGLHAIWDYSIFIQDHSGPEPHRQARRRWRLPPVPRHRPRHRCPRDDPEDR